MEEQLLSLALEGSFPDTKLVVTFMDEAQRRKRIQRFRVWPIGFQPPEGDWGNPASFAVLVGENVIVPPR